MDKLLHFWISFVLTITLNSFTPKDKAEKLAFSVGTSKEVWDYYNPPHTAEWGDLLADYIGVKLGGMISVSVPCRSD